MLTVCDTLITAVIVILVAILIVFIPFYHAVHKSTETSDRFDFGLTVYTFAAIFICMFIVLCWTFSISLGAIVAIFVFLILTITLFFTGLFVLPQLILVAVTIFVCTTFSCSN